MKFRKKPVVIEAKQFDGENFEEIHNFVGGVRGEKGWVEICTLEGNMKAGIGDWIIKGVKGEFYTCKPDIFEDTYQRVYEDEVFEFKGVK